jgi:hypothetical protein
MMAGFAIGLSITMVLPPAFTATGQYGLRKIPPGI